MRFKLFKSRCFLSVLFLSCFILNSEGAIASEKNNSESTDCGCDHIIKPSDNVWLNGNSYGAKPGDVICLQAGTYPYMAFFNFRGTQEAPITIKNCGGVVNVGTGGLGNVFSIKNSEYVHLTGSGTAGEKYGIKVSNTINGGTTFVIEEQSSYIEVDHVEIFNSGYAGISVKQDPKCGQPASYNFTMKGISLHDLYVHDVKGEGFYIGYSHYSKDCSGTAILPHKLHGLRVYNNRVENTGRDGIQVSRANLDCKIYNNVVKNYGLEREDWHSAGILIGDETTGSLNNNWIEGGTVGMGIQVFGPGDNYVYNNVILSPATDGIFCDDRRTISGKGFYFINNTIINPGGDGILMYSTQSTGNIFANNLIVNPGNKTKYADPTKAYINIFRSGIDYKVYNNLFAPSVVEVKFLSVTEKKFSLQLGSPAIDNGRDASVWQVIKDFEGTARPQGSGFDIGAYEYKVLPNQAPRVNGGNDQSLVLPTNSTSLTATATDADGTVANYAWVQSSGPSTAVLSGASTAKLTISSLKEGAYVFTVTVKDNNGAAATDQVNVVVNPAMNGNKAPLANAGADKSLTLPMNSLTLSGNGSDEDGEIISYVWSKEDGPSTAKMGNTNAANLDVSDMEEGVYLFRLKVEDNNGAIGIDDVTVVVSKESNPLSAHNNEEENFIELFPNPTHNKITIRIKNNNEEHINCKIFNSSGSEVISHDYKVKNGLLEQKISLEKLGQGMYFLYLVGARQVIGKRSFFLLKN